jgi:general secretion pathway protein I
MMAHRLDRGFTLLEVMVALAIISTALVTLLGTHLMSLTLAQKNKEQTLAAMLARRKIGEIRTMPFDSLASDSGDFGPDYPGAGWEMEVGAADIDNLKKVKLLLQLPEGEFEIETLVARRTIE